MRAIAHVGMMIFVFIALIAILFMVDAAYAQEVTEAPTAIVTVEPTPAPETPPVVVVEQPTSGIAIETFIIIIGGIVVGFGWIMDRSNIRLEKSAPADILITFAELLAARTPNQLDDEVVEYLKQLFKDARPTSPVVPTPDEAVG